MVAGQTEQCNAAHAMINAFLGERLLAKQPCHAWRLLRRLQAMQAGCKAGLQIDQQINQACSTPTFRFDLSLCTP
jgi:hypothetical protein